MNVGRNTAAASIHDHLYLYMMTMMITTAIMEMTTTYCACMYVCVLYKTVCMCARNKLTFLGRLLAVIPIAGDSPSQRKSRLS